MLADALDRWPVVLILVCATLFALPIAATFFVELGGAAIARFLSWRRWVRTRLMIDRRERGTTSAPTRYRVRDAH